MKICKKCGEEKELNFFGKNNSSFYRLKDSLRHRISESLKSKGFSKKSKTSYILGYTFEYFKTYIESKFEFWMTW